MTSECFSMLPDEVLSILMDIWDTLRPRVTAPTGAAPGVGARAAGALNSRVNREAFGALPLSIRSLLRQPGPGTGRPCLQWQYEIMALVALGVSGYSLMRSLVELLTSDGRRIGSQDGVFDVGYNGTLVQAFAHLSNPVCGLVELMQDRIGRDRTNIVRLSPKGVDNVGKFLEGHGLGLAEDEWSQIESRHRGAAQHEEVTGSADEPRQRRHTAQICAFAHNARIRGYRSLVVPTMANEPGKMNDNEHRPEPDVAILAPNGEHIQVEIQTPGGERLKRRFKFYRIWYWQDFVALCTWSRADMWRCIRQIELADCKRILATNIYDLRIQPADQVWTVTAGYGTTDRVPGDHKVVRPRPPARITFAQCQRPGKRGRP